MAKKSKKPPEPKEEKKGKMGRYDSELYNTIVNFYERSKKVIEDRGIFKNAERYTKMYENDPWRAKGLERAEHLSEIKIAVAFDVIETGLSVVTARAPMPDIQPRFSEDNEEFATIQELRAKIREEEAYLKALISLVGSARFRWAMASPSGKMERTDVFLQPCQETIPGYRNMLAC